MRLFTIVFVVAFTVSTAQAGAPQLISFQGLLTDNAGDPVNDASYSVTFTIYDDPGTGASVWSETQNVSTIGGQFSVMLGSVNPILDTVFNGTSRYLGIAIGSDPELSPRTALVSVPFAHRVSTIDGSISTKLVLDEPGVNRIEIATGNNVLQVFDQDNDLRIRMTMGSSASPNSHGSGQQIDGGGAVEFFRKSFALRQRSDQVFSPTEEMVAGAQLIKLGESQFGTGEIETFDQDGRRLTKISSGSLEGGSFDTYLPDSTLLTTQGQATDTSGYIGTWRADGTPSVALTSLAGAPTGAIATFDSTGVWQAAMWVNGSGDGEWQLWSDTGSFLTRSSKSGGGGGYVLTYGPNGSRNVWIGDGTSSNDGGVFVHDSLGVVRAGIIIDGSGLGQVFGDVKAFAMDYPQQPGKEIWYASLEGPEAAAYYRGTANLVNGVAFVNFPDHFKQVVNSAGLTVQVTPLSANTPGLAVVEKSDHRIVVRELQNGTGNFGFDFTITGVRKGYESFSPVREKLEVAPTRTIDPANKARFPKYRNASKPRSD